MLLLFIFVTLGTHLKAACLTLSFSFNSCSYEKSKKVPSTGNLSPHSDGTEAENTKNRDFVKCILFLILIYCLSLPATVAMSSWKKSTMQ